MSQPLPDRTGVLFVQHLFPKHDGRDRMPSQTYLQDIEDDDRDGEAEPIQRTRRVKQHGGTTPGYEARSNPIGDWSAKLRSAKILTIPGAQNQTACHGSQIFGTLSGENPKRSTAFSSQNWRRIVHYRRSERSEFVVVSIRDLRGRRIPGPDFLRFQMLP